MKVLKQDQDALNEYYRQFPRTEEHAFRDETKNSLFNLAKIYEQIDYNEDLRNTNVVTTGNFQWVNGIKDTKVVFMPTPQGRFKVSWIPGASLQNRQITKKMVLNTRVMSTSAHLVAIATTYRELPMVRVQKGLYTDSLSSLWKMHRQVHSSLSI